MTSTSKLLIASSTRHFASLLAGGVVAHGAVVAAPAGNFVEGLIGLGAAAVCLAWPWLRKVDPALPPVTFTAVATIANVVASLASELGSAHQRGDLDTAQTLSQTLGLLIGNTNPPSPTLAEIEGLIQHYLEPHLAADSDEAPTPPDPLAMSVAKELREWWKNKDALSAAQWNVAMDNVAPTALPADVQWVSDGQWLVDAERRAKAAQDNVAPTALPADAQWVADGKWLADAERRAKAAQDSAAPTPPATEKPFSDDVQIETGLALDPEAAMPAELGLVEGCIPTVEGYVPNGLASGSDAINVQPETGLAFTLPVNGVGVQPETGLVHAPTLAERGPLPTIFGNSAAKEA